MRGNKILTDSHVHTDFSADSPSPMEDMAEHAVKLGLSSICFTEHMDYDFPPEEDGREFVFDVPAYLEKVASLKEEYGVLSDRHRQVTQITDMRKQADEITDMRKSRRIIKIRQGIELGLKPELSARLKILTSKYPFDFVIGSTHLVNGDDPCLISFWDKVSERQGITDYFEATLKNVLAGNDVDVYGHIDYILRYTPTMRQLLKDNKNTNNYYDKCISFTGEIISEILKKIIESGKGIEINSSGLKYGLGYPHPHTWILKRYKELGGEIITVGSDAHSPEYIAYGFSTIIQILLYCGFTHYTVYENRKPCFIKL